LISVGSEVQVLPGPPNSRRSERPLSVDRRPRPGDGSGDIAQLVEHLLCKQGVTGSNPVVSMPVAWAGCLGGRCEDDDRAGSDACGRRHTMAVFAVRSRDRGGPALSRESGLPAPIAVMPAVLFFVTVYQVLVRLWTRATEADACPRSSRRPIDV
jgi:hypothetical protein